MPLSTVTSKGQTTIPAPIREFLHLSAGDRIEFIAQDDGRVLIVPATLDAGALKGILPRPKKPVTLEAMQNASTGRNRS